MCRKLGTVARDLTEDQATRHHAAAALEALDAALRDILPQAEEHKDRDLSLQIESDILPMFRQNWLADEQPNRFDFITQVDDKTE
mmetsp:Transcript_14953/g.48829  ORF Transcript_14953/g.48829 Transcript_14953/m.48829 type:complete len:85 (+) Transcript_14953:1488-1742(+)